MEALKLTRKRAAVIVALAAIAYGEGMGSEDLVTEYVMLTEIVATWPELMSGEFAYLPWPEWRKGA